MKKKFIEKYSNTEGLTIEELEKDLDQFENHIKDECAENIQQAVRYYLKYQNYPMWEDKSEYQKGVQVACENIEELIEEDFIRDSKENEIDDFSTHYDRFQVKEDE